MKRKRERGNGEGSVFKLSGNRKRPWAVRITCGWDRKTGKQITKYLSYHRTRGEAKAALREYLVNPFDLSAKNVTFLSLFEQWEKTTKVSPVTLKGYRSAFNQAYALHNRKIRDVRIPELEDALYALKPSMQGGLKNVLQHIYKQAIKNDVIEKNLADFLEPIRVENKKREPFTVEQIEQIKAFDHPYTDIAVMLLYTGMRINELLTLKREDVFLSERYMVGGIKTKAGKDRVIPIHDEIVELVEKYYKNGGEFLVENHGRPVVYRTFMTVFWSKLQGHLESDQTPHCARHTFITFADRCGLNKTAVKKIVGHTTGDVTDDVYNHRSIAELLSEMNKLKYEKPL